MNRARVRDLLLRGLGVVHLIAFASLWAQLDVLMGSRGLLPAREWLDMTPFTATPSLFHLAASDGVLHAGAAVGVLASVALILGLAPRLVLVIVWALYLSFVTAGSQFFAFQWDTLLLESTFVAWFVAPWGWRPRKAGSPGAVPTFLVLALLVKLHLESGVSKLVSGDESWRDLTAMASYYETAPLPTPLAWWAHQLPLAMHRATSLLVLVLEIGVPALVFAGRRARAVAFALLAGLQLATWLTASYAFFNLLTVVLCIFILDDSHLAWIAGRFGRTLEPRTEAPSPRRPELVLAGVASVLSVLPFLAVWQVPLVDRVTDLYAPLRTLNAYHLFATMTGVRREAVIEGSLDGKEWEEYDLRWKPGDPRRAPSFVAPYHPRVDFLLWFARLGGHDITYLERLVDRLLRDPESVRSLFAKMPFSGKAPRYVRIATYQYTFTDLDTRRETGAWWDRVNLPRETSEVMSRVR